MASCYSIAERLTNFFISGKFSDIKIAFADGTSIRAHRIYLARKSDYFKALFKYSHEKEFHFPPHLISEGSFGQVMLNRVYNIATDEFSETNVADLKLHADYFGFEQLAESSQSALLSYLDPTNCEFVLDFACHFPSLEDAVVSYLIDNFQAVRAAKSGSLVGLPLAILKVVLSSPRLDVSLEVEVWEMVSEWVSADLASRQRHVLELLPLVRLGLLTHSDGVRVAREFGVLAGGGSTSDLPTLLKTAEDFQRWKHVGEDVDLQRPLLPAAMVEIRFPKTCCIATGGWTQLQPSKSIELYDCKNDMWFALPDIQLPGPRAYHGCIEVDGKVYIIGGFDGTVYFKNLFCLDLATMEWTELPPMHFKRCYVSVVSHRGLIFVMGGYDGVNENRRLTTCERFDPQTNQWTTMANMKKPRSDASAVVNDGQIFIAGGFNGEHYLTTVEKYDIAENKWTQIKSMNTNRGGVGCAILHEKMYAIGGHDGSSRLSTVECLDLRNPLAAWMQVQPMITTRSNFGVCTIDGQILVAGGYEHPSTTTKCEYFDGSMWHVAQDFGRAVSALAMTSVSKSFELCNFVKQEEVRDYLNKKRSNRMNALKALDDLILAEDLKAVDRQALKDAQGKCFDIYTIPCETSGEQENYRRIMRMSIRILQSASKMMNTERYF